MGRFCEGKRGGVLNTDSKHSSREYRSESGQVTSYPPRHYLGDNQPDSIPAMLFVVIILTCIDYFLIVCRAVKGLFRGRKG